MSRLVFFPGIFDLCVSTVGACVCQHCHDIFLRLVIGTEMSPGMHRMQRWGGKAGNSFMLLPSQRTPRIHGFIGLVVNVSIDNTSQKRSKTRGWSKVSSEFLSANYLLVNTTGLGLLSGCTANFTTELTLQLNFLSSRQRLCIHTSASVDNKEVSLEAKEKVSFQESPACWFF